MTIERAVLITDLDNTLYDFIEFFGPTFRSMVHVLSKETGICEERLRKSFRDLYKEKGTIEYKFAVQSLDVFQNEEQEWLKRLIDLVRLAYVRTRRVHLKLYDGVADTLTELAGGGVTICAMSNAPIYHVYRRLLELNILRHFHVICAWEGVYDIRNKSDPFFEQYNKSRARIEKMLERGDKISYGLGSHERKPSRTPFERIIGVIGERDVSYFAAGDNKEKDLYWPQKMGMATIWAKYGKVKLGKNLDTVIDITHWEEKKVEQEYNYDGIEADYEIESFRELLKIIPYSKQFSLF